MLQILMTWKKNGEKFWMLNLSESFAKPKIYSTFVFVKNI